MCLLSFLHHRWSSNSVSHGSSSTKIKFVYPTGITQQASLQDRAKWGKWWWSSECHVIKCCCKDWRGRWGNRRLPGVKTWQGQACLLCVPNLQWSPTLCNKSRVNQATDETTAPDERGSCFLLPACWVVEFTTFVLSSLNPCHSLAETQEEELRGMWQTMMNIPLWGKAANATMSLPCSCSP